MGIQKKRPSSRSLPAGRAGFAGSACPLVTRELAGKREGTVASRRGELFCSNKIICVGTARLFVPVRAHVTSQISVGWRRSADYPPAPRNFPANSEFYRQFPKIVNFGHLGDPNSSESAER